MKYAHLDNDGKILGWYSDDIHGTYVQAVYEEKIIQEEQRDEENNIIQEEIKESVLVKDGYYDISNIPTPNIEVSDEVWQEAININANVYEDGSFIVKDLRTAEEIEEDIKLVAKENKLKALDSLIVSANTVPFDADNQSINYMSSVIGLASFKMLQGMYNISDAKEIEELTEFDSLIISLYETTFKSRVEWKNANNTISNVQLETVAEALEKSMQEVSNIIVGE